MMLHSLQLLAIEDPLDLSQVLRREVLVQDGLQAVGLGLGSHGYGAYDDAMLLVLKVNGPLMRTRIVSGKNLFRNLQ